MNLIPKTGAFVFLQRSPETPAPFAHWKLDIVENDTAAEARRGTSLAISRSEKLTDDERRGHVFQFERGDGQVFDTRDVFEAWLRWPVPVV
jgi:hypothetical protein